MRKKLISWDETMLVLPARTRKHRGKTKKTCYVLDVFVLCVFLSVVYYFRISDVTRRHNLCAQIVNH